jgi:hypothetical protein
MSETRTAHEIPQRGFASKPRVGREAYPEVKDAKANDFITFMQPDARQDSTHIPDYDIEYIPFGGN